MTSPDLYSELAPAGAPDDLALLRRVAEGDRESFRRLYSHYHRRLNRFLMRLTRDRQLAEEVINDTMLSCGSTRATSAAIRAFPRGYWASAIAVR